MEKMNLNIGTDSFDGQDEMSYFDSFSRNDSIFRGRYDKIREKCMELVEKDLNEKMGNWAKGLNILQAAYDKDGGQRTTVLVALRKARRYLQEFRCWGNVNHSLEKEFCSAAEGTINDPGTADTVTDGAEGCINSS